MPHVSRALCPALLVLLGAGALAAQEPPVRLGAPTLRLSHDFSQVAGVAELRSGRLIVADSRDHLLYLVDPATNRVVQLGTKGQGPDEYQNAWGLIRLPGDTILVYDPSNNKFLRVTPEGRIAGGIPIAAAARRGGMSQPRGADTAGRVYWDRVVVAQDAAGEFKRRATVDLVRWKPGTETVDTLGHAADHAVAMHEHRFHPFAERDAWIVTPDGGVGVIVAATYRLRWLGPRGAVLSEGPQLPNERVPVTGAEREAFRNERALRPAGNAQMTGPPPRPGSAPSAAARRGMEVTYPDEMFPRFMPPVEESGAWRSPGGEIWVARTRPAGTAARLVDILDASGSLRRRLELPAGRKVVALEAGGIYLAREDSDGLQYLERYSWPAGWR